MDASNYSKRTHREHILELPDTYIGSIDKETQSRWIFDLDSRKMVWKAVDFVPGFFKIFDEILVNATDHHVRQQERIRKGEKDVQPVTTIRITLTPTTISVSNDGDTIPTSIHPEYACPLPQLIFGQLLTSSNYNKEEEKIVGGKNGYGAKLTNIFSKEFSVKIANPTSGTISAYTWRNNMTEMLPAKITKAKITSSQTMITYTPDLSRFHFMTDGVITEIPSDMMDVIRTRCYDAAVCVASKIDKKGGCAIFLNGTQIPVPSLASYMELFISSSNDKKLKAYESAGERWEVGAILTSRLYNDSPPDDRHLSFVNGIMTRRGGKHVEYVSKQVLTEFCVLAKKKAKIDITPALLKDSLTWYVRSVIVNPSFDTQTKEYLTTPASKFGSKPDIPSTFYDQLIKIGLLEEAQHILAAKQLKEAKKTDGKKKASVRGIPKLEDALWAGTGKSNECTLILTEGDSAASTAISGLKVVGRESYGVFPLRGKLLNVKDIAMAKKTANEELNNIKKIIGLEYGKKYSKLEQLRYGRVMIMTDQDVDGSHIKGLLINLFHTEWPALLKMGFLCCLMTPLLKVSKSSTTLSFYNEKEYEDWRSAQSESSQRGWKTKYYKGLGTSTAAEAREYFENMHTADFQWDETADGSIDMAFNKKRSDDRKLWLSTYDAKRVLDVSAGGSKIPYTDFINDELIHFSSADNIRSIPSVMDGLKPGQRKILWACFKRNLTQEIRVAQLAGYVSEVAAYHHGEASLNSTIIGMAQIYVGSNNINLLAPNGQFGTRLMGGKDAASPRYIHTHLEPVLKTIFRKEDEPILNHVGDDGTPVEPENYYPVIPMLLVNGSIGIGTGFSTEVLSYNPIDLVAGVKAILQGEVISVKDRVFKPWWLGFRGDVKPATDKKGWMTTGMFEFLNDDKHQIRIKELPVGTWTKDYKDFLERVLAGDEKGFEGTLKNFEEAYNDVDVDFILTLSDDAYWSAKTYPSEFVTKFKLTSTYRLSNMVAFDSAGKIRRYASVGEIVDEFVSVRLRIYEKRRLYILAELERQLVELRAKHKFISAVITGNLKLGNVADEILLASLQDLLLPPISVIGQTLAKATLDGYEYLLRMRIDRLKKSAVDKLEEEINIAEEEIKRLQGLTASALWLADLEEFTGAWSGYITKRAETTDGSVTVKKKKVVSRKPKV